MDISTFNLDRLFQIKPDFLINLLFSVLTIFVILVFCYLLLKGLKRILNIVEAKQIMSPPFTKFFHSIFKWLIVLITILLVLQQSGIELNSLWAVISAMTAMVAIGFVAVWSVLSNLLCTLMLIIFHPFRIGDDIEIIDPAMTSGIGGNVRNINLMFTTLSSMENDPHNRYLIHIPNNLFFQKILRMKTRSNTIDLDLQLFEEASLLHQKNGTAK